MKKVCRMLFAGLIAFSLAGCATTTHDIQKKFTRKKKAPDHVASVVPLDEGPYQKQFSNDYYYKTHYTLWQSWQDEMMKQLGGNNKKVERAADGALGELKQMSEYLRPEKRAELQPEIDSLSSIVSRIKTGSALAAREGGLRVELGRIRRVVAGGFYYDKVKDSILTDKVDLGDSSANAAASSAAAPPAGP